MTASRPRLIVLKPDVLADNGRLAALKSAFDVVEIENLDALAGEMARDPGVAVLLSSDLVPPSQPSDDLSDEARLVLQRIGEGVGVVDASGELRWSNQRLRDASPAIRGAFVDVCSRAIDQLGKPADGEVEDTQKFSVEAGSNCFEVVVSGGARDADGNLETIIGVLVDVTASRRLQAKIDAIDAAGSELMRIESQAVSTLNMAERLKLLEEKIVHYVTDLLNFDNFEIRLLDRHSNQLELVIAVGLKPLKIGEVIYAEDENNGISGWVAARGRSYLCHDVFKDPLYCEGLDDARSSLTVPLRLHDQVIGVFNVESFTAGAFDEYDRQFAEIFGRYIAMAMNILDLLVVERFTTNEQVAENVLGELNEPLSEIATLAESLLNEKMSKKVRERVTEILDGTETIRNRLTSVMAGPRTILGAEQEMRHPGTDPIMAGKRILIADDEAIIRETLQQLLSQRGCVVTTCENGGDTLDAIDRAQASGEVYHLVISDIKMPDRNGYEIFRKVRTYSDDTPVVLMTGFGYDPHHSIVRASQEGLHSLLFKPFKASQLLETVQKAFT